MHLPSLPGTGCPLVGTVSFRETTARFETLLTHAIVNMFGTVSLAASPDWQMASLGERQEFVCQ
jgi:hypothetical protein